MNIIPPIHLAFDMAKEGLETILSDQNPAGKKELLDELIKNVQRCVFSVDDIELFCRETVRKEEIFNRELFEQELADQTKCLRLYTYFKIAQSKQQQIAQRIWSVVSRVSEKDMGGPFQIAEFQSEQGACEYLSTYFARKIQIIEKKIQPNEN